MVTIDDAAAADRGVIGELARLLHGEEAPAVTPTRQASRTFVAREGDRAVGFAICTLVDYGLSRTGQLEELAIAEDVRGRRIGHQLVAACESWLRGEGIEVLFVSALIGAEDYYERLGFTRCTGPWLNKPLVSPA